MKKKQNIASFHEQNRIGQIHKNFRKPTSEPNKRHHSNDIHG